MDIGFGYKNLMTGLRLTGDCLDTIKSLRQKKQQMQQKTYILQKNLPFFDKGTEIKPTSALAYGIITNTNIFYEWRKDLVENNPEWFKLKEEENYVFNLDKINLQIEKLEYAKEVAIDVLEFIKFRI